MSKMSNSARKAYAKALKNKRKNSPKKSHWLFIQKGDGVKEVASKILTQIAVIVLIGCMLILGNELYLSLAAKNLNSTLQDLYNKFITSDFSDNDGKLLSSAEALLEINPDTIGWVSIAGTNIDLPVVQHRAEDGNEYYLKRAFDGSSNKAGTIFLDVRNTLTYSSRSDNLTLYGHNQKDKTMFGDLAKYKNNIEFYREHPIIKFSSNYENDDYKIFAYFVTPVLPSQTSDGVVFDYHNFYNFGDPARYEEFIANINARNEIITPVDVHYGDEFLTLSTCSNEFEPSRFVVFARKVRTNEDSVVDTAAASLNPNAKEPEWDVIYG
jgi:sortase B